MAIVQPYRIGSNISYLPVSYHQNWTKGKSTWTISEPEQRTCFERAYHSCWLLPEEGWGLHYNSKNRLDYLGVAEDHSTPVFIAKFVCGGGQNIWHGYPADYQRNSRDIPDVPIQKKWLAGNILPPRTIKRIARGQACSLPK